MATLLGTVVLAIATMQPARAEEGVGVRQITAPSEQRGTNLDVTVWYPAQPGGESVTLGDSPLFAGASAMRDAPITAGKYPLILLSHGAGLAGNPQALSWLAAPLAKHGFIVAAPAHPGNSGPNRSARETMKLWLRPSDLSETLNALEGATAFREHLIPGDVGMLGLSMGGTTAFAIAGARLDEKLLASYCDTDRLNASLCGWIRQSGVDLHAMDLKPAGRDNRDERIRFAMAIDPAPADVFAFESFADISIPMEIVNLGRPENIPATAQASGIARAIPHADYRLIEDASHFSMFGECKPDAAKILASEQIDEPLCADGDGRSRAEIHRQLIDMTTAAFDRALKGSP
ncbi:dienelactone hydrolase [Kaistia sp. 32K]|nr:dienelactone hydrolase [Kaistia sp. 32K]